MNVIARYRQMHAITRAEFANLIGVSQGAVYQYEKEIRPVPEKVCVRIEKRTQGLLTRQELKPNDWAEIWPELKGADHERA